MIKFEYINVSKDYLWMALDVLAIMKWGLQLFNAWGMK
jgi:hypothetical protein